MRVSPTPALRVAPRRSLLGNAIAALLLSGPLLAQEQPDEVLPGAKLNSVFGVGLGSGLDQPNIMSGDPMARVRFSPRYRLSAAYEFEMMGFQTSKVWKFDSTCTNPELITSHATILGLPSLGAGWHLTMGFITPPQSNGVVWVTADGGQHTFSPIPEIPGSYETQDGSHVRMVPIGSPVSAYELTLPDGTRLFFDRRFTWPQGSQGYQDFTFVGWRPVPYLESFFGLTRITDRFGTVVLRVDHVAAHPSPDAWKIDRIVLNPDTGWSRPLVFHWRQHTVPVPGGYGNPPTWDVLDWIDVPAPEGRTQRVTFAFGTPGGSGAFPVFKRNEYDTSVLPLAPCPNKPLVAVPLLDSVTISDAAPSPSFPPYTYSFRYSLRNDLGTSRVDDGILTEITSPTGSRIRYAYAETVSGWCFAGICSNPNAEDWDPVVGIGGSRVLNSPPDADHDRFQRYIDASAAVVSRTVEDLAAGGPASTTTYDRFQFYLQTPDFKTDTTRSTRTVVVKRPDGNGGIVADKHLFHVSMTSGTTRYTGGLEKERRHYAGADTSPASTPVKTIVNCFEGDSGSPTCGYKDPSGNVLAYVLGNNVRKQKDVEWYGLRPAGGGDCSQSTVHCRQTESLGYNPYAGEYGTVRTTANNVTLVPSNFLSRTETTTWTRNSAFAPWLLKLYSARTKTDSYIGGACPNPPCSTTTNYDFDPTNGFLRSMTRSDPATGSSLTQTYTNDGLGNPVQETSTGTGGVVGTSQKIRSFLNGQLLTSRWNPSPGWLGADVTRDFNTGAVTASRDANGLTTTYIYDGVSRLRAITPPGTMPSRYCYSMWSSTGISSYVLAKQSFFDDCSTNAGNPADGSGSFEAQQFDGHGRVVRRFRRLPNDVGGPGNKLVFQRTRYTAAGQVSFVSEWAPCSTNDVVACFAAETTKGTTYSSFDVFGRPRTVTRADGTWTTHVYDDLWGGPANADLTEITIERNRQTSTQCSVKATRKDIFGNVLIATDAHNSCNAFDAILAQRALYGYNVLDKLAAVSYDPPGQTRTFRYDTIGLLRSEKHPELPATEGPDPLATTSYPLYNTQGKPLSKELRNGWGTLYNAFTFTYDTANRLLETRADDGTGSKLYTSSTYDTVFHPSSPCQVWSYSKGKLTTQTSYHPGTTDTYTDIFCYEDSAGRLTKKRTTLGPGIDQEWSYATIGLVDRHIHPRLTQKVPAWHTTFQTRTVYRSGLPVQMFADYLVGATNVTQTVASGITYNPSGGLLSYAAGNGVINTIVQDLNLMPRPRQITTQLASTNFDSGIYGYDGEGNITGIGSDTYTYDAQSRLIASRLFDSAGTHDETFTFDLQSNMTQRSVIDNFIPAPPIALPTSAATNRLLPDASQQLVAEYDRPGNLTRYGRAATGIHEYVYDAISRQREHRFGGATEKHFYDAAGERILRKAPTAAVNPLGLGTGFYTMTPCRLINTTTTHGPPLQANVERTFTAFGLAGCPVPSNAQVLAANVTALASSGTGSLRVFPTGLPERPIASVTAVQSGKTRATQALISLNPAGKFTVFPDFGGVGNTHLLVDIAGYFGPTSSAPNITRETHYGTFRDEKNRLLTDYRAEYDIDNTTGNATVHPGEDARVEKDYVYLGNQLIATYSQIGGWRYYTNDHLGSPRLITDGSRNVVAQYKYRPFGTPLSPASPAQGMDFCGMEKDALSGNHFVHARFLSSWTGRFNGVDRLNGQVDKVQSWNRYAYCSGNPVGRLDRTGLEDGYFARSVAHFEKAMREAKQVLILEGSLGFSEHVGVRLGPVGALQEVGTSLKADNNGNVFHETSARFQLGFLGAKIGPYFENKTFLMRNGAPADGAEPPVKTEGGIVTVGGVNETTAGLASGSIEAMSDLGLTVSGSFGLAGGEVGLNLSSATRAAGNFGLGIVTGLTGLASAVGEVFVGGAKGENPASQTCVSNPASCPGVGGTME